MTSPNLARTQATPARIVMEPIEVIARLERAGRTLLALPRTGPTTRLVQSGMEWVSDTQDVYAQTRSRIRPAIPDAATITQMDEALAWIPLIPVDQYVMRRIVGARSLVDPINDRHLFSWRRLGIAMGADHKAVKQWHQKAIAIIVARLRDPSGQLGRALPKPARHHRGPDA